MKHKLAIAALTQDKWNAQKRAPSHGSLAWDLASTDSRMAVVYTKRGSNMIFTFLTERQTVPSTYHIKQVSKARNIERLLFALNQFRVSAEILVDKQLIFY